ncbi:DUF4880 domain-containing protein [Parasphingopyxis algicola]|uniref:FecR family protein n=1 Tax=Parasphingopyxis algicola TaxID=2026624 RepID=UPI0015A2EB4E|nr:FecR domain-containing protein [Parasphingopyxis algicola]QLC24409.1 DUF4880 domain-containing protein [Parasphingopyxis algicola]
MIDDEIVARAAAWHLRVEGGEMRTPDWEEFTSWLEADALHAEAYNRTVEADADLVAAAHAGILDSAPEAANDQAPTSRRRFLAGGVAIAATAIAGVLLWPSQSQQDFTTYATAAGERRTISVSDGLRVEMNGGTEIAVADGGQPTVRLEGGEAAFFVESRQPGALRVEVGALTLVDNGTIFNVIRHDGWIRAGVAEGAIVANPDSEAVTLTAGQTLRLREGSGMIERGQAEPQDVTAWRDGQLAYSDTPAPVIAADLSRNLGVTVNVDQEIGRRRLTGIIQLDGDEDAIIANAAALLDGYARQTANGWMIAAN